MFQDGVDDGPNLLAEDQNKVSVCNEVLFDPFCLT